MPVKEWGVADDKRLRAQSQSIHDFVYNSYFTLDELLEPGSCLTNGTAAEVNNWPSIALATGVTRYASNNIVRPDFWTTGRLRMHTFWAANNTTASRVVRLNFAIGITHPGDTAYDLYGTLSVSYTLPTVAYEVFEIDVTGANIVGLGHSQTGPPHGSGFLTARVEREGGHGDDNYSGPVYFLAAKLQFEPSDTVRD